MAGAYGELKEHQRLLYGQNLLKTYVIELDRESRTDWQSSFANAAFVVYPTRDLDLATGGSLVVGLHTNYIVTSLVGSSRVIASGWSRLKPPIA